jgi:UPF0042 nucleotide-binding protein
VDVRLTVITGMSGAGKSQALGAFEDAGWFSVDNLPPGLLPSLSDLLLLDGAPFESAAVVCDIRGGAWFSDLAEVLDQVAESVEVRILFLEASDDDLVRRFSETRRPHPLAANVTLPEAIELERKQLAGMRERADVVIDSSSLSIWDLRRAVFAAMTQSGGPRLHVDFVSFGFKHGLPRDADLVFDVRFLRNPHYVPELAALTGLDSEVREFLDAAPSMAPFLERLEGLLDFLLPAYVEEGKSRLSIAFGCTGGRHRSVALAEIMAERYRHQGYDVSVFHRHIDKPHSSVAIPVDADQESS